MTRNLRYMAGLMLLLLIAASASTALAEEAKAEVALEDAVEPAKDENAWKAPWRGSSFTYRNQITAYTLDKDADLTYNPTYVMDWAFHPQWWVGDIFNVYLDFDISRELTQADDTTYADETLMSDTVLTLAASKFATIPVLDIGISATLGLMAPTSKLSQSRTTVFGLMPGLGLRRHFDVLAGIDVGYKFGFSKAFHESTTAQNEQASIQSYGNSAEVSREVEEFRNMGIRNANWSISNGFSLSVAFIDQLSVDVGFRMRHAFLYEQDFSDEDGVSTSAYSNDDGIRYSMSYNLGLNITPIDAFSIGLGAETDNGQLKADGTYERPFFNRNTVVYLDLTLDIDGLVKQLTSKEE